MAAMNSCTACRQRKRGCDRGRPRCSTCVRAGRACIYDEDASATSQPIVQYALPDITAPAVPHQPVVPSTLPLPNPLSNFDPFQNPTLRTRLVDAAVAAEVVKQLGSLDKVSDISRSYFKSIYKRLPTISPGRFEARLPSLSTSSPASFTAMCLCMHLVQQSPVTNEDSMHSTLYFVVKSIISLMEGAGYNDIETVQCRAMVSFYEMGHGIYPAATVSIASCARLARVINLDKSVEEGTHSLEEKIQIEERRRVWWAVANMDRFINLSNGDSLFSTPDFTSSSTIPIDDDTWLHNTIPTEPSHRISTPSSLTVGVFARECQIMHLTGLVIRHVCDFTLNTDFRIEEALQLERTLEAFMPLLLEATPVYGKYCVALSIATSALFILNDSLMKRGLRDNAKAFEKLGDLSSQIAAFSIRLFGEGKLIDYTQLSPYIMYSIYQSAVVQTVLWKETHDEASMEKASWLRTLLGLINRRWRAAGIYLKASERERLALVLSLQD